MVRMCARGSPAWNDHSSSPACRRVQAAAGWEYNRKQGEDRLKKIAVEEEERQFYMQLEKVRRTCGGR